MKSNFFFLMIVILLGFSSCNKCYECTRTSGQSTGEFCSEDVQNIDDYIKDLENQGYTCDSK